jgi:hypothetical protein
MQTEEIQKGQGGSEAPLIHGQPGRAGADQGQGESQSSPDVDPSRGDQYTSIKFRPQITSSDIFLLSGEMPGIGDHSAILKICEKLYPVVRHLPTWKEPNWSKDTLPGVLFSSITLAIRQWKNDWSEYYPIREVFIGDPRVRQESGRRRRTQRVQESRKNDGSVWLLYAYPCSCEAAMPQMSFLADLKSEDRKLYDILCAVLGKLRSVNGLQLWDHMTDTMDEYSSSETAQEAWGVNNDPDPEFVQDFEEKKATYANYWEDCEVHLKYCSSMGRLSMVKLEKMIKRYKWTTKFKKRILAWVTTGITLIKSKVSVFDYAVPDLEQDQNDDGFALHAGAYQWFRWYGAHSYNGMEGEIDQMMQASYQEGGFYPFRKLVKYTTDQELLAIMNDPYPNMFDDFMWEGFRFFNSKFLTNLRKK